MPAVVTLTTDFGLRDSYVAQMKGVLLGISRDIRIVDVTHEVEPHDIMAGALILEEAVGCFPPGTVHLAIVDPGVGTARRGLVVAAGDCLLVGPDNGLFTPFLGGDGWAAFEISARQFRRPVVSPTFHGRDVFAPAAAHLAMGLPPGRLGPAVHDPVRLAWPRPRAVGAEVVGEVISVDRFGNLVTSIRADMVVAAGRQATVRVGDRPVKLVRTYGDLERGEPGALIGSSNRLEIVVREGSARAQLDATRGTAIVLIRC